MKKFPVRWAVVTVVVLAIAGLGYWGVKTLTTDKDDERVMAFKPVTRGDMQVTVRGWGQLTATQEQDVISGAKGVVREVFFQSGGNVTKGQVMATVDPGTLAVDLRNAEIKLEAKKIALAQAFGVPMEQVASVDPEIALTVKAPISGRVSGLALSAGSKADAGKICSIVDDSKLLIRLQLPKPLYDLISVGTSVTFRADRFEGGTDGTVTKIDHNPIKGESAYYYDIAAEIPNPGLLKVGDTGILIFHGKGQEFQQNTEIASFAVEELVNSAVSGRVKAVHAREGMVVQKGDPILELEEGEALLNAMTLQLEVKGLITNVENYQSQLANLSIVAPIDGTVVNQNIVAGQQVDAGTTIARVSNFTEMKLSLSVDEMDVPKVQPGQLADVTVWGESGQQKIQGEVSQIGAMGSARDGISSFGITIAIVNPGFLRPYMGAEAQIYVSDRADVLLCPIEALYKEEDKWYADVRNGDKEVVPTEVEIGAMNDQFAEIMSGLSEGQEVVVGSTKTEDEQGGSVGVSKAIRVW